MISYFPRTTSYSLLLLLLLPISLFPFLTRASIYLTRCQSSSAPTPTPTPQSQKTPPIQSPTARSPLTSTLSTLPPFPHLPRSPIPAPHTPLANIIPVVILRPAPHHRLAERDIDSPTLAACPLAAPLGDTVQPIRLRGAAHQDHVAAAEGQFERFLRKGFRVLTRRNGFVFQEEVSAGTEREGRDGGHGAQEALVVAVVGYAVCAGGVVVYEAEVVGA